MQLDQSKVLNANSTEQFHKVNQTKQIIQSLLQKTNYTSIIAQSKLHWENCTNQIAQSLLHIRNSKIPISQSKLQRIKAWTKHKLHIPKGHCVII